MNAVALLSGGIDSPVALYVMAKRMDCIALFMDIQPYGEEPRDKVQTLVRRVEQAADVSVPLYTAPFGRVVQREIQRHPHRRYRCLLCKRMMYRVAARLADDVDARLLVTGENLGQVASQTLFNLQVIDDAVSLPVVRPLIGLDKQEIIDIARRIGTYSRSITGGTGCTLVPSQPATRSTHAALQEEEAKLDVQALVAATAEQLAREKL